MSLVDNLAASSALNPVDPDKDSARRNSYRCSFPVCSLGTRLESSVAKG